jgi:hypothetical protein
MTDASTAGTSSGKGLLAGALGDELQPLSHNKAINPKKRIKHIASVSPLKKHAITAVSLTKIEEGGYYQANGLIMKY